MKILLVIPARYGSTRLPGKPLELIQGQTMLNRVVNVAKEGLKKFPDAKIIVATDHEKIKNHCQEINVDCQMTSPLCQSGTDRVFETCQSLTYTPDLIINLQGDAPLTPPHFISELIEKFDPTYEMITPIRQLTWTELETLQKQKETTPFSGTFAIINSHNEALWFSKQIIPAIRKPNKANPLSPVFQHIGLYAYTYPLLKQFITWPQGTYEQLEGLEQLRVLENGHKIHTIKVHSNFPLGGVDTPEDLQRATQALSQKLDHQPG